MKLIGSKSTREVQSGAGKRKKSRVGKAFAAIFALIAATLAVFAVYVFTMSAKCKTILPNVSVYGVELGGMSRSDAEGEIAERLGSDSARVMLEFSTGEKLSFTSSEVIADYSAERLAEAAWKYGRTGEKVGFFSYLTSLRGEKELFNSEGYDEALLRDKISRFSTQVNSALVDGAYTVKGRSLTIVKGASGVLVDENEVFGLVSEAIRSRRFGKISYEPDFSAPDNLSVRDIYGIICKEPKNAEFDEEFNITESEKGLTFDLEKAEQMYDSAEDGAVISVTLEILEPEVSTEKLQNMLYGSLLASWTSSLTSNEGRSKNIELAANEINGYIMMPGDVFSFNDVVGERTKERGFSAAPAYVGAQTVDQVGGGICQVSSSIYYCCLLANLEIVYRTNHRYTAAYVPLGMDATVSWGGPEFKFKNNTEYPIRIDIRREGNNLFCEIYGTKTDDTYIKMTYAVLETYNYEVKYVEDESVSPGHSRTKTSGITGYKVESYKSVYDGNDELISRGSEAVSVYSARDQVVLIAPGEMYLYDPSAATVAPTATPTVAPSPTPAAEDNGESEGFEPPEESPSPGAEGGESVPISD